MATLHLICGLPCSGKTTLARQLETSLPALRFTPDEWHTRLFGQDVLEPQHDERHNLVEELLWNVGARALVLGVDVILDFGFWSRAERRTFCDEAAGLGAECKLYVLDVPKDVLLERLAKRNASLKEGEAYIPEATLKSWFPLFELEPDQTPSLPSS